MKIDKENFVETLNATGKTLYDQVKKLLKEGNVRTITIRSKAGKDLVKFPLTVGVIGAVILPYVAILSVIIGLATECSIIVERTDQTPVNNEPTMPVKTG